MKAVVGILSCLLVGQLLYSASAQPVVAFTRESQNVFINEEPPPPDNEGAFCVVIVSGSIAGALTVTMHTTVIGATIVAETPGDFTTNPPVATNMVQVTFPAGTVTAGADECVVVTGVPDSIAEGTEVLGFTIDESMPLLYTVDGTANSVTEIARVFVVDDDAPAFSFELDAYSGSEDSSLMVCVEVTPLAAATTVEITTDLVIMSGATATLNTDFTIQTPLTLTFPVGSTSTTSRCRAVTLLPDDDVEGNEMFTLSLSPPSSGMIGTISTTVVTIMDDDAAIACLTMPQPASVMEGSSIDVTLTLSAVTLSGDVTVTVATADDTGGANPAEAGDYTPVNNQMFIFSSGGSRTVTVATSPDMTVEGSETLLLQIVGVSALATTCTTTPSVTLTILDDDTASVQIAAGTSTNSAAEGDASQQNVCVTVMATAGTSIESTLTVSFALSGKTSLLSPDITEYTGTTTISAGLVTSTSSCASFRIIDDTFLEGDHLLTFTIDGVTPMAGVSFGPPTNTHVLTIMDNDDPGNTARFEYVDDSDTVMEADGAMAQICIRLAGLLTTSDPDVTLGCDVTATMEIDGGLLANDPDDYTVPADLDLVFPEGSGNGDSRCLNIPIVNDNDFEGDHTFQVGVRTVTPNIVDGVALGDAPVIIQDSVDATVSLTSGTYSGAEGNNVMVCVRAVLSGGIGLGTFQSDLVVSLTAVDDSATSPDYTLPASFFVTFDTNSMSGDTLCVTIGLAPDTLKEGDESFTVSISDSGDAGTQTPTSATVTIEDDDGVEIVIIETPDSVVEGSSINVCVRLRPQSGGNANSLAVALTLSLSTFNGKADGSDYDRGPHEIMIPPGTAIPSDGTHCATIGTTQDELVEGDHDFDISISMISHEDVVRGSPSTNTITISDSGDGVAMLSFATGPQTVTEGGGPVTVCAALGLPSGKSLGCDISVPFRGVSGERGNLGDDFTMPVDSDGDPGITTEMFLVSENPSDGDTRCINIMIVDDDDYECDQEFLVNFGTLPQLSSLVTSIGSVPVTISDNGDATVRMAEMEVDVDEDVATGTRDVCVNSGITGDIELELEVLLESNNGKATKGATEDFTDPVSLAVVFSVNDPVTPPMEPLCVTFNILDDEVLEGDHDFTVTISSLGSGSCAAISNTQSTTIVTIDDDEVGEVTFNDTGSSVDEGNPTTGVCLTVSGGGASSLGCDLTLTLTTIPGKAEVDDFDDNEYTVEFMDGTGFPLTGCVAIDTDEDFILEGDHAFTVNITGASPNDAVVINTLSSTHMVTIDDDESPATITLQDVTSPLSEGGSPDVLVCAEINGLPSGRLGCDITVGFNVENDSAVIVEDFTVDLSTLNQIFSSGSTSNGDSVCINIGIVEDDIYEEDQQFNVRIASLSPSTAANSASPDSVSITIQDNDDAEAEFVTDQYSVGEEGGSISVCVESGVTQGFQAELTVTLTAEDGKATVANDTGLSTTPFNLVFPIGHPTSTYCKDIPITSDADLEDDHEFSVTITAAGSDPHATIGTRTTITITILDDERGLLTMASIEAVTEGDDVMVCINLICSGSTLGCPLEVNLGVTGSSKAVVGDDFEAGPHSVSFAVGSSLPVQSCTNISTVNDNNVEGGHGFEVEITTISLPVSVTTLATVGEIATINDNDAVTVGFSPNVYNFNGGMGDVDLTLEVSNLVDSGILECDVDVTVNLMDGPKATRGEDYDSANPLVVTLPATTTVNGDTFPVPITILSDEAVEGLHSFTAEVADTSLVTPWTSATINIIDNDFAAVQMAASEYSVGEGDGSVEVCAELTSVPVGGLECEISVTLAFSDGTKTESGMDYTGTMAVVIFPKSSVEGDTVCADIQILDDDALECSQNFIVSIESATLGTDIPDSQDEAVVTIEDNDGVNVVLDFSQEDFVINEFAGSVDICMDLTDLPAEGLECDLVIPLNLLDGKARSDSDYTRDPDLSITFDATTEDDPMNRCASIAIENDDNVECDHSFTVEVGDIDCDTDPAIVSASASATVTIVDDDEITISMKDGSLIVDEGIAAGSQDLCVVVDIPSGGEVECALTVTVRPVPDTANLLAEKEDYEEGNQAIEIPVGAMTGLEYCRDISTFIINDEILESTELFSIVLTSVSPCGNMGTDDTTVVEIIDNDKLEAGFLITEYALDEGSEVEVCVRLEGAVERVIGDIEVNVKSIIGDDSDYDIDKNRLGFGLNASATYCVRDEELCFTFQAVDDEIKEEEEKFKLILSTTDDDVCFCSEQAHVTIEEDVTDEVTVSLSVMNDSVVSEASGAMLVLVNLVGELEVYVTVTVSTVEGSAKEDDDYRGVSHKIVFNSDMLGPQRVYIPLLNDDCLENEELFSVTLTTEMDCVVLEDHEVTITIQDDDLAKFTLERAFYEVDENIESLDICVILKSPIKRNVSVSLTHDNRSAVEGSDFNAPPVLDWTFPAGRVAGDSYCFTYTIEDGECVEDNEFFPVSLTSSDSDVEFHISRAEVRILDNDYVRIGVQSQIYNVDENEGNVTLCIEIVDGCLERDVLINYATFDATALNVSDYESLIGRLTFEAGSGQGDSVCVTIEIVDDDVRESIASFVFALCEAGDEDVNIIDCYADVNIIDDDSVSVSLSLGNQAGTVPEDNGAVLVLVNLNGELRSEVTVHLETNEGTALESVDYVEVSHDIIFNQQTELVQPVYIPLRNDDDCVEGNTFFSVDLFALMDRVDLGIDSVTITILDDDRPEISLASADFYVDENEVAVSICVELKSYLKRDIDLYLEVVGNTAIAGPDFDGTSPLHHTFLDGSSPGDRVYFDIQINNDEIVEANEYFAVSLFDPDQILEIHIDTANVHIKDDDSACVNFTQVAYIAAEQDGFVEVCVELEGEIEDYITVYLFSIPGTAAADLDFIPLREALTFHASGVLCANVTILMGDSAEDLEKFSVVLTTHDDRIEVKEYWVPIYIRDSNIVRIGFNQTTYAAPEEDDSGEGYEVEVCINRSGELERSVAVYLTTASGSATGGDDYNEVLMELTTVQFVFEGRRKRSDTYDDQQCITLSFLSDTLVEDAESFSVLLSTDDPVVMLNPPSAEVIILNNDRAEITLRDGAPTVNEGEGEVEVCIELTAGELAIDVTVVLNTADESAFAGDDYEAQINTELVFTAGSPSGESMCTSISIEDDEIVEENERFSFALTSDDPIDFVGSNGDVFIVDGDTITIAWEQNTYLVNETAQIVTACARIISGILDRDVVVQVETTDSTTSPRTTSGDDYEPNTVDKTFDASTDRLCVAVDIEDDTLPEPPVEFFSLLLSSMDSAAVFNPAVADVGIQNDDIEIRFAQEDYAVCEGQSLLGVCVEINGGRVDPIVFTMSTALIGSADNDDFGMTSRDFNTLGETTLCLDIVIEDNTLLESCETFEVRVTDSNIIPSPDAATITIYDNEVPTIEYINDTPDITGNVMTAEFEVQGCVETTVCQEGSGGTPFPCSSPLILNFEQSGARNVTIIAQGFCGNQRVLSRISRSDNPVCHLHQINGGEEEATVIGNTATVMFEETGPSMDNVVTDFRIALQREQDFGTGTVEQEILCSQANGALLTFGVSCTVNTVTGHGEVTVSDINPPGRYGIRIQPQQPLTGVQCTNLRPRRFDFDIGN